MNKKKIIKKFKSKGYTLRPETLHFIEENLEEVNRFEQRTNADKTTLETLIDIIQKCQQHIHENGLATNIMELAVVESVIENIRNSGSNFIML
jgi:hypothetical protein